MGRIDVESAESPGLVLVVDGDPAVQKLVATVFKLYLNARVVVAADGEQGLELARELKPDVVVLAIRLPKLDGFEVARRLKADPLSQSIPLVALSSEPSHTVLAAGFDGHVFRPFGVMQLVQTVNGYVNRQLKGGGTGEVADRPRSRADLATQEVGVVKA